MYMITKYMWEISSSDNSFSFEIELVSVPITSDCSFSVGTGEGAEDLDQMMYKEKRFLFFDTFLFDNFGYFLFPF